MLQNHGLLTCSASIADTFLMMFIFQRACEIQVMAQGGGAQLITIDGNAGSEQGLSAIDQLKAGDKVAVWAQKVNGQVIASKIVVVPQTPERIHYVGLIVTASADRLDVIGQQGETTSFRLDEMVQRLPEAGYAPQVGDTVTIVAKPDPRGEGWLAVAVVKQ
jgi:hypothetical protein